MHYSLLIKAEHRPATYSQLFVQFQMSVHAVLFYTLSIAETTAVVCSVRWTQSKYTIVASVVH